MAQGGGDSVYCGFDFLFRSVQEPGVGAGNAIDGVRRRSKIDVSQDQMDQRSKASALGARSAMQDAFDLNTIGVSGWRFHRVGCEDHTEAWRPAPLQILLARRFPVVVGLSTLEGTAILV